MMLVWVISRVMLAREELGQDQDQQAEIEMVAMLDVRQFQSLLVNITKHNITLFISLIYKEGRVAILTQPHSFLSVDHEVGIFSKQTKCRGIWLP